MKALPEVRLAPVRPLGQDVSALGLAVGGALDVGQTGPYADVSVSLVAVVGSPGGLELFVPAVCWKAMVDDTGAVGGLVVMRVVYVGSGTVNTEL